jgi:hypothetical protein
MGEHTHGKEGVDGSSPSEGFDELPANWRFALPAHQVCRNGRLAWGQVLGTGQQVTVLGKS